MADAWNRGAPVVRTLSNQIARSKGHAFCRIGDRELHPIPAGERYHKVVQIVDGEFWSATMCGEHDVFRYEDRT